MLVATRMDSVDNLESLPKDHSIQIKTLQPGLKEICCDIIFFKSPEVVTCLRYILFSYCSVLISSFHVCQWEGFQRSLPNSDFCYFLIPVPWRSLSWHSALHSSLKLLWHLQHCHVDVFWELSPWEHKHHGEVSTVTCITQNRKTKHKGSLIPNLQYGMPRAVSWLRAYDILHLLANGYCNKQQLYVNSILQYCNSSCEWHYQLHM